MPYIILGIIVLILYGLLIYLLFSYVAPFVFGIGTVLSAGLVFGTYVVSLYLGLRGKLPEQTAHPEMPDLPDPESKKKRDPAFKNYFFRKAYIDYGRIVTYAFHNSAAHLAIGLEKFKAVFQNEALVFTWPIALTVILVGLVAICFAGALFLSMGLVHIVFVGAVCVAAYLMALFMRIVEWGAMQWRRIFLACPRCYHRIKYRVHLCDNPQCGAHHNKLVPGSYGIFRRRCQCGRLLPTSFLVGRSRLASQCPHCEGTLNSAVGDARNLHLPIVGGPASGKSSFLVSMLIEFENKCRAFDRELSFPEARQAQIFESNKQQFAHGETVHKTGDLSPESFLIRFKAPAPTVLFMYDTAGELYIDDKVLSGHKYFEYLNGLIFMIDPFALPNIQLNYERQLQENRNDLQPSREPPQNVYDRMFQNLRNQTGNREGAMAKPIAVVISKTDAFAMGDEFDLASEKNQAIIEQNKLEKKPVEAQKSAVIRAWLTRNGGVGLVKCLEADFKYVRYFECSALGRMPAASDHSAFTPREVFPPAKWILGQEGIHLDVRQWFSIRGEFMGTLVGILLALLVFTSIPLGGVLGANFYFHGGNLFESSSSRSNPPPTQPPTQPQPPPEPDGSASTGSTRPVAEGPPRVTARVSNADDEAILYVNGVEAVRTGWGRGEGGASIGHRPGDSGWVDISNYLHPGDNTLRLWVWNAAIMGGVSGAFEVKTNDIIAVSRSFARQDSQEGVKYDETLTFSLPPAPADTSAATPPPEAVPPPAPSAAATPFFRVSGIRSNDVLWIRRSANPDADRMGSIPPEARCVLSLKESSTYAGNGREWYKVRYNGIEGWSSSLYLVPDDPGACSSAPAPVSPEPPPPAASSTSAEDEIRAHLTRYAETESQGDLKAHLRLYDDYVSWYDKTVSRAELKKIFSPLFSKSTSMEMQIDNISITVDRNDPDSATAVLNKYFRFIKPGKDFCGEVRAVHTFRKVRGVWLTTGVREIGNPLWVEKRDCSRKTRSRH